MPVPASNPIDAAADAWMQAAMAGLRSKDLLRFTKDSTRRYDAAPCHRDICARLEKFSDDVAAGKNPRLMLFMPPRHGKSFIASERFPAWHLGRNPDHQIIATSYADSLAETFSRKSRDLAASAYFRTIFPDLRVVRDNVSHWHVQEMGPDGKPKVDPISGTPIEVGGYRPAGVGAGIGGMGANVLIIDDPVKDQEQADSETMREKVWDWYTSTAYTRLLPGAGVLIITTRWHHDDLAGRLLDAMEKGEGDTWEVIRYPAIAEEDEPTGRMKGEALHAARYPLDRLLKIQKVAGPRKWTALYQQRPTPEDGDIFQRKWFKFWEELPEGGFDETAISVDAAFKDKESSSFVVVQTWGRKGPDFYLVDEQRGHWGLVDTIKAVQAARAARPTSHIWIEDKANGTAVIKIMKERFPGVVALEPEGSKESRAYAVQPAFEAGNVYIPKFATWREEFIREFLEFPHATINDRVDACSQALVKWITDSFELGEVQVPWI